MLSSRPTVLAVEDDPLVSEMLVALLGTAGYAVETADTGTAGLERIEAGGIDLILLDVMLPEMDGWELCRRVRAHEREGCLPIIMVTALAHPRQRHVGFDAGADDYVAKPFDMTELLDRIRAQLRTHQRLKASEEQLRQARAEQRAAESLTRVDWLTGLYNRRHLDDVLAREVSRAQRHGQALSLLLVDSDNLKPVNDTCGHHAGDALLRALAAVLREQARAADTVVRYGGDEFVVLLPDTEGADACRVAERLRAAVETLGFAWDGQHVPISVTIGVAALRPDDANGAALLARADTALYAGKRAGRNRVVAAPEAGPLPRRRTACEVA